MKEQIVYFDNIVDDVTYYIGTNARDNFDVIDMGRPNDIWFHAKDVSSCHVVVHVPDFIEKQGLRTIIKRGARLCKEHTTKLNNPDKIDIIYTCVKNVAKTEIIGCVTTKHAKTITC
jgi:predicted ribosome quality control (RQC) complex YloA/Tae2 family protein